MNSFGLFEYPELNFTLFEYIKHHDFNASKNVRPELKFT